MSSFSFTDLNSDELRSVARSPYIPMPIRIEANRVLCNRGMGLDLERAEDLSKVCEPSLETRLAHAKPGEAVPCSKEELRLRGQCFTPDPIPTTSKSPVDNGKDGTYYDLEISNWTHARHAYECEQILSHHVPHIALCCNDIIESLEMDYALGNAFKALWRIAAARQGRLKAGGNKKYDAEKAVFFSERLLVKESNEEPN